MPTLPKAIITEAKRLEKLQARRRKLNRELRDVEKEIKLVRRNLKALGNTSDDIETPDGQLPANWKGKVQ